MVTGGFKVWHIIFIILAVIVTTIVIYCCFHRCRIPRTKQEIEADLMRSNLGNKFRDYLQELPNEPFTFTEALKKVQEIEEKLEQDDAQLSRELGARKRMGWIKLKGKEKEPKDKDKQDSDKQDESNQANKEAVDQAANQPPQANGAQMADAVTAMPGTDGMKDKPVNGQLLAPEAAAGTASATETKRDDKQQSNGKADSLDRAGILGDGDKAPARSAAAKRRRQKPNLSRTKRAKERPLLAESGDHLERPAERPAYLELPEQTDKRTSRTHKKKPKPEKGESETHTRPEDH